MEKLRVALYGENGHQIDALLAGHPRACFAAAAGMHEERIARHPDGAQVLRFPDLPSLLRAGAADLVCLCSPRRVDQVRDAILCLEHGVAVYAEKPCALSVPELDRVLEVAKRTGVEFHEIADTAFYEPYHTFGKFVRGGGIGQIVQAYAQKSYPTYFPNRPGDEEIDGGLTMQIGIHAVRFLEHVLGLRVERLSGVQTKTGNRGVGDLHMAASLVALCRGGVPASVCLNYCNPTSFGQWGNECLRVFGTAGMAEITDGGRHTHLYTEAGDLGELDLSASDCRSFFDLLVDHLLDGAPMPFSLEEELHPLRVLLAAKETLAEA